MDRARGIARVLSIAGSDSGGGAGIQADLKAFARCGVHGMTAITAITAQHTAGVIAVERVSPALIVAQVEAVIDDIGVDAVKIGMLGDRTTVVAVADALELLAPGTPIVLDPVMVSESGAPLLSAAARAALVATLLGRVSVVTPNVAEARALLDRPAPGGQPDGSEIEELARALVARGARAVLVTGGHRREATDLLFDGVRAIEFSGRRFPGGGAHGSGCTHSAVLAARLALGDTLPDAARTARAVAGEAVRDALRELGRGAGPVDVLGISRARTASRHDDAGPPASAPRTRDALP